MARYEFTLQNKTIATDIQANGPGFTVTSGDRYYHFSPRGNGVFAVTVDGRTAIAAAIRHKGTYFIDVDGMQFELREASDDAVAGGAGDQAGQKDKIFAPMPGKIVKVMVAVGDEVEVKQPMVIVEAMKMENQVNAKAKGRVKAVNFAAGDQVDTEKPIIELELHE